MSKFGRFVRNSKFRHVFGTELKKDQCYDDIRISRTALDTLLCDANPKFVAICTEAAGGGSFLVLPLEKTGRVERDTPQVTGHKGAVIEVKWCPHNDNVIASGSEDCTVKVWQIPDGGLTKDLEEPVLTFLEHQRRINIIQWHPSAHNVILTASSEPMIFVWNVGTCEVISSVQESDLIFSASFSYDGSMFATTTKDKKLKVYKSRTCELLKETSSHEGAKPAICIFLKDSRIFTTGFSRMSERQYALWNADTLEQISLEEIDTNNGVLTPFYDPDSSMVYLGGKGDTLIRYYEVVDDQIYYLAAYQSKEPQRGMGFMPKRGLNVNACEIARFYKLVHSGLCQVIPFTVPRKSDLFQDDLYPDTRGDIPAITAEEFMAGKNSEPILISLKSNHEQPKKKENVAVKKPNILATPKAAPNRTSVAANSTAADTPAPTKTSAQASAPAPAGPTLPADFDVQKLLKDLADLKSVVKKQDKKIAVLEDKLSAIEEREGDENGD